VKVFKDPSGYSTLRLALYSSARDSEYKKEQPVVVHLAFTCLASVLPPRVIIEVPDLTLLIAQLPISEPPVLQIGRGGLGRLGTRNLAVQFPRPEPN
jgi:hypothetical protein